VATSIAIDKPETALTATAVLVSFLVIYFVTKKKKPNNV
jgi:hypothetical protein